MNLTSDASAQNVIVNCIEQCCKTHFMRWASLCMPMSASPKPAEIRVQVRYSCVLGFFCLYILYLLFTVPRSSNSKLVQHLLKEIDDNAYYFSNDFSRVSSGTQVVAAARGWGLISILHFPCLNVHCFCLSSTRLSVFSCVPHPPLHLLSVPNASFKLGPFI